MSDYSLESPAVSPELVMEIATVLSNADNPMSKDDLLVVITEDESLIDSALHLGLQLDMLETNEDKYMLNPDAEMSISYGTNNSSPGLVEPYLRGYRPFITFLSSLIQSEDPERAAREARVIHSLGVHNEVVEEQFVELGECAGILSTEGDEVCVDLETDILQRRYSEMVAGGIRDETTARLFLDNKLGGEVVAYMDDESLEEFIYALTKFDEEPQQAIFTAAGATESFLRKIAEEDGNKDYSDASGVGDLIQLMQGDSDLVHTRHLKGGEYLAGLRNPGAAHGVDRETLERWSVSTDVALEFVMSSLHLIKSTYHYIKKSEQIL